MYKSTLHTYKELRGRAKGEGDAEEEKEEGEEMNVTIMDNALKLYLYVYNIYVWCVIILSACQRDLAFSESRRQKGPPRTTIDGLYTMRSRDGYNVSLRFCDLRSIFYFSINPAAHNTINDIQKLFSDHVCLWVILPTRYICIFISAFHQSLPPFLGIHICICYAYIIYNINVWYVYIHYT